MWILNQYVTQLSFNKQQECQGAFVTFQMQFSHQAFHTLASLSQDLAKIHTSFWLRALRAVPFLGNLAPPTFVKPTFANLVASLLAYLHMMSASVEL